MDDLKDDDVPEVEFRASRIVVPHKTNKSRPARDFALDVAGSFIKDIPGPASYDPKVEATSSLLGSPKLKIRKEFVQTKYGNTQVVPGPGAYDIRRDPIVPPRMKTVTDRRALEENLKDYRKLDVSPGPGAYYAKPVQKESFNGPILPKRCSHRPRTTVDHRNFNIKDSYIADYLCRMKDGAGTIPSPCPPKIGPGAYFEDIFAPDPRKKSHNSFMGSKIFEPPPRVGDAVPGPASYNINIEFNHTPLSTSATTRSPKNSERMIAKSEFILNGKQKNGSWRKKDSSLIGYKSPYGFTKPKPQFLRLKIER